AACNSQRLLQVAYPGFRYTLSQVAQAIVAAALVVQRRVWPLVRLDDQPIFQHMLDRAIECGWANAHLAPGLPGDFLHNTITVPLTISESQQDMKHCWREWEQAFRALFKWLHHFSFLSHEISALTITVMGIITRRDRHCQDIKGSYLLSELAGN